MDEAIRSAAETYIHIGIPLTDKELRAVKTMREVCKNYLTASKVVPEDINGFEFYSSQLEAEAFTEGYRHCRSLILPLIVERDRRIAQLQKENEELRKDNEHYITCVDGSHEKLLDYKVSIEQLQSTLAEKEKECKKLEEDMWIWVEKHNKVAEELYNLKEHSQSKPSLECEHDWFIDPMPMVTSNSMATKWRCKKCLITKMTYD